MRWLIVGTLLWLVFMVVSLPTRFVLQQLPPIPAVTFTSPSGTAWSGGVCVQNPMIPELACLQWQFSLLSALEGRAAWSVESSIGAAEAKAIASVSGDDWRVNGLLQVPMGQSIPSWAGWLPAGGASNQKKLDYAGRWK